MGWVSKLLSCASVPKEKDPSPTNLPLTIRDVLSEKENDDKNGSGNSVNDSEDDEELPQRLYEILNMDYSPPRRHGKGKMHQQPPKRSSKICAGCNSELDNAQPYRSYGNAYWHILCCNCLLCTKPIARSEHPKMFKGSLCHASCYPKCDVCGRIFSRDNDGRFEYQRNFWNQKICPSHLNDDTSRCCSCSRMKQPQNRGYIVLSDGRELCLECKNTAIMDTESCQPLYKSLQNFYKSLNMKVDIGIPVHLVERGALMENINDDVHAVSQGKTIYGRENETQEILIMFGLPRLHTGSILAHEMMRAWLRSEGYPQLEETVEEGICEIMSYMWMETELPCTAENSFERAFALYLMHLIESNDNIVYGDGFRAARPVVHKYGLEETLRHIRKTGNFLRVEEASHS